jgi:formiminotetrahydrofolate cyclodeaminase
VTSRGTARDEALFSLPLDEVLARTAARTSYPGGGAVAAWCCASAAALVEMVATYAGDPGLRALDEVRSYGSELRRLADDDADGFAPLLAAWRRPADDPGRRAAIRSAAARACDVPLRTCEVGLRIAEHAARLVREGKPDLVGDAATAAYVAHAGVRSAARLVRINARLAGDRTLDDRAAALTAQADDAVADLDSTPR